jgi:hypothetical protein
VTWGCSSNARSSDLTADDPACTALAHFALEAPRAIRGHDNPREAMIRAFELLANGWDALSGEA